MIECKLSTAGRQMSRSGLLYSLHYCWICFVIVKESLKLDKSKTLHTYSNTLGSNTNILRPLKLEKCVHARYKCIVT